MTDNITLTEFIPGGKVKAQEINGNLTTLKEAVESKVDSSDTSVTKQGNTFNGANQLVQLNSSVQLPASDGSLIMNVSPAINALGIITSDFTISANRVTTANVISSCVLSLPIVIDSTKEVKCIFDFTTSNASYPTLPSGILKKDGKALTFSALSGVRNKLIFTTIDGGITWEAELHLYGGVETTFIRPNLASNGILGGSAFAVSVDSEFNNNGYGYGYMAFDASSSTRWFAAGWPTGWMIIYNPVALKVSSFNVNNSYDGSSHYVTGGNIYASNDGVTYTYLNSFINSNVVDNATWNLPISSSSQGFYKYYKISITNTFGNNNPAIANIGINATYIATL